MNTIDFQTFFETELKPQLSALEQYRKTNVKGNILTYLFLVILIAWIFLAHSSDPALFVFGIFALSVITIGVFFHFSSKQDIYRSLFKRQVIVPLIKFISPNLEYDPNDGITRLQFVTSGLYGLADDYSSEDMVRGLIGNTRISFCEILASQGRGNNNTKVFEGIFFIADFNKEFNGKTIIYPITSRLDQLNKKLHAFIHSEKLVRLENIEFGNNFEVYSNDQVEARYIITPAFMEKLLEVEKKFNSNITISFVQTFICIGIPLNKNLFEPQAFKSVDNSDYIEEYYHYLQMAIGIVNDLNLNTRIWTKE